MVFCKDCIHKVTHKLGHICKKEALQTYVYSKDPCKFYEKKSPWWKFWSS